MASKRITGLKSNDRVKHLAEVERLIGLIEAGTSDQRKETCNCDVPNQVQCDVHGPRE